MIWTYIFPSIFACWSTKRETVDSIVSVEPVGIPEMEEMKKETTLTVSVTESTLESLNNSMGFPLK